MRTIFETNFKFENLKEFYKGKVRDVYFLQNDIVVMIVTDRISAFDVVLNRAIPFKGHILNEIASFFLDKTSDIVPNWKIACPDPNVTVGYYCKPYPVEIIVRGYLTGSLWREYKKGVRNVCGIDLPDAMKENQKFDVPIITPTTKAVSGHDVNISKKEIIENGIMTEEEFDQIEKYALALFNRGTEYAKQRNLILVDTKYEFGKKDGKIYLIDEIHTPDSSRYFYADDYEERFNSGLSPRQLSKEFVREWLIEKGFMGLPGQHLPEITDDVVEAISNRYIELYETITGKKFIKPDVDDIKTRIFMNITEFLNKLSVKA